MEVLKRVVVQASRNGFSKFVMCYDDMKSLYEENCNIALATKAIFNLAKASDVKDDMAGNAAQVKLMATVKPINFSPLQEQTHGPSASGGRGAPLIKSRRNRYRYGWN